VKALDGTEIRLSDLRGKAVLLDFWATWCKPCVAFVPTLKTFYGEASQRKDFVMIGMSLDEPEERLRQFVKERQLSWPQVRLGASSRVAASYVPDGTVPRYVLIGPDGKIILPDAKGLQEIKDHLEDPQSAGPTAPHKQ
jgi:thiol-disulfide isomerase/thioredoxin